MLLTYVKTLASTTEKTILPAYYMKKYLALHSHSIHLLPCLTLSLISSIIWMHFNGSFITGGILLASLTMISYFYSFPIAQKKRYNIIFVYLAFFSGIAQYRSTEHKYDDFFHNYSHITLLQGEIYAIERCSNKQFNYIVTLQAHHIQSDANNTDTTHYINIYTCKKPHCQIGDVVILENLDIKKPSNSEFLTYLKKEKVSATLFVPYISIRILHRPFIHFKRAISSYKNTLIASLKKKLSPLASSLFLTIFLGKKSQQKHTIRQPCKIWGISHYLARSGLHLLLFILILHFFLSLIHIGYRLQSILLIILGMVYYILSWPSISFNRAFFAFILNKIATLSLLSVTPAHILNLVCFTTLLTNPYHLFFLDFQLSFSLAFTITYFNEALRQRQFAYIKKPNL